MFNAVKFLFNDAQLCQEVKPMGKIWNQKIKESDTRPEQMWIWYTALPYAELLMFPLLMF
jgi:hypothetical protein